MCADTHRHIRRRTAKLLARGDERRYVGRLDDVIKLLDALAPLAWPVLVALVLWRLLPTIRDVIGSRGFTVKAGSAEITVQQASDQMLDRVEDLREQLSALKLQVGAIDGVGGTAISPITRGVPQLRRVLWVDDHPENNAYEVEALQRHGVTVQIAHTTAEGLHAAEHAEPPYDAVVTDMGREEDGTERAEAGLQLIEALNERQLPSPVIVYASARAINRTRERFEAAGAQGTASATELLEMLGRIATA